MTLKDLYEIKEFSNQQDFKKEMLNIIFNGKINNIIFNDEPVYLKYHVHKERLFDDYSIEELKNYIKERNNWIIIKLKDKVKKTYTYNYTEEDKAFKKEYNRKYFQANRERLIEKTKQYQNNYRKKLGLKMD